MAIRIAGTIQRAANIHLRGGSTSDSPVPTCGAAARGPARLAEMAKRSAFA